MFGLVLVGSSTNQNIPANRAAFGLRHVVGGYHLAAVAGSGALIGAVARAGTAARKCFQLNSSVWASVWASVGKCLEASLTGEVNRDVW